MEEQWYVFKRKKDLSMDDRICISVHILFITFHNIFLNTSIVYGYVAYKYNTLVYSNW